MSPVAFTLLGLLGIGSLGTGDLGAVDADVGGPAPALASPLDETAATSDEPVADGVCDINAARGLHLCPGGTDLLSKKAKWLAEKRRRPDVRMTDATMDEIADQVRRDARRKARRERKGRRAKKDEGLPDELSPPGTRMVPVTTLYNTHTREMLPLLTAPTAKARFHGFLRDHFTNVSTRMDVDLVDVLASAARKFDAPRIEVVSGYRSPKYNRMLRKKGRQVARTSQHTQGKAVDFRIRRVRTRNLLDFVRSLRLGGVGFYPRSGFVHADTGRVRYWTGS